MSGETEIRSFRVDMPGDAVADLRRRVAATCWASRELVADAAQGVQLAMLQELARYWAADYDWRRCEAELNALPQFTTEIDGLGIHFIHVRSRHENALPLIITHGWPGSVIEMLGVVGPLAGRPAVAAAPDPPQLPEDLPRLPRQAACRQPHPGEDPGQHHPVLADRHRDLVGPAVLGAGTDHRCPHRVREKAPKLSLPVGFTVFPGEIL